MALPEEVPDWEQTDRDLLRKDVGNKMSMTGRLRTYAAMDALVTVHVGGNSEAYWV